MFPWKDQFINKYRLKYISQWLANLTTCCLQKLSKTDSGSNPKNRIVEVQYYIADIGCLATNSFIGCLHEYGSDNRADFIFETM